NRKESEAETYFRSCLGIAREYGLDHPKATALLVNFCSLLHRRGKQAEARDLLDEALQVRQKRRPKGHAAIADVKVIQARLLAEEGRSSPRRQLLQEA